MEEIKKLQSPESGDDFGDREVKKRQVKQKIELLEELKRTPIIELVCKKIGIGRATFYRWKKDDDDFADDVNEAIRLGGELVSDMAESQLLAAIRDGNFSAVSFWLKHNHPRYANKLEVTGKVKTDDLTLTDEQRAVIDQALCFAAASGRKESYDDIGKGKSDTENKK